MPMRERLEFMSRNELEDLREHGIIMSQGLILRFGSIVCANPIVPKSSEDQAFLLPLSGTAVLTGDEFDAELRTDHRASNNGQPVIVASCVPIEPIGMQIVELSQDELDGLPLVWQAAMPAD